MPLDARKAKKIVANYKRILLQRTQQVTLTLQQPGGSTSTLVLSGIFRPTEDNDPSLHPDTADPLHSADAVLQLLTSDITPAQLR